MQYIYSALLLHSSGKEISEASVSSVLKAAGIEADAAKLKAMVASLKDVNIEEAVKQAVVVAAPVEGKAEDKKESKAKEEESEKAAESAAEGLGSLFG